MPITSGVQQTEMKGPLNPRISFGKTILWAPQAFSQKNFVTEASLEKILSLKDKWPKFDFDMHPP